MLYSLAAFSTIATAVATKGLGDSLWRTFGHQTALPLTSAAAEADGWVAISSCDNNLGVLYAQDKSGPSEKHPLALYFTDSGAVAGVQATISGSGKKVGDAAPKNLVDLGYWKPNDDGTWRMDVSFRAPSEMCSGKDASTVNGDRVVINQDTIAQSIPLTAGEARDSLWTQGSCMSSMGQHHFYDLKAAPEQSYEFDQLVPLVAMYNPPFDPAGTLNAFFFTTPVAQPGSSAWYLLSGAADWESPALTSSLMCQNWCDDDNCSWPSSWATMHIYVDSAWDGLKCPGGSGPVGRSCDL